VFEKRRKKETIATTGNVDRGELWGSKTGGIHASMSEILIFLPLTAKVDSLQGGMALDCASMLCCAVLCCFVSDMRQALIRVYFYINFFFRPIKDEGFQRSTTPPFVQCLF
jgi:hypothetical protein